MKKIGIVLLCFLFATLCLLDAQEKSPKNLDYRRYLKKERPEAFPSAGYLAFVLACLGAGIVVTVWMLKKALQRKPGTGKLMALKETLYLGNKTFLHAVEIEGKTIVIGVGPQRVSHITEFTTPEKAGETAPEKNAGFGEILAAMIAKKKDE